MAPRLILAVAAHREVACRRERAQQLDQMPRLGSIHLGPIAPAECLPSGVAQGPGSRPGDELGTGSEFRQPHVVEVATCVLGFGNAAGRVPDGTDSGAFMLLSRRAQADNSDRHYGPASVRLIVEVRSLPMCRIKDREDEGQVPAGGARVADSLDR